MSEVRHDPLTGETVIIAPSRSARPHSSSQAKPSCPFCPGQEAETPPSVLELSLGESDAWFVRVFPNLFPIVSSSIEPGPRDERHASGVHEVIVETPYHDQEMHNRTPAEVALALTAYRERLHALLNTPGIRYVSIFQNRGARAGASLEHPHSQIVALSYVPDTIDARVQRWRRHHEQTSRCLLCDELSREREEGARVVLEQDGFVLYSPHGAVRPGEMILAPEHHTPGFVQVHDDGLLDMSLVLISALKRLHAVFDNPSTNLVLQTWPPGHETDSALHWYLRVIPRTAQLGGFELSTDDFVSTLAPEDAAERYRAAANR